MCKLFIHLKNIGPGAIVAAAFIGPGTITTCIKAGTENGYTLLWAVLFSTIALIIIQEISSRLGIVTQMGLGENIRDKIKPPFLRYLSVCIVFISILLGNTAFETGNITGSIMGLNMMSNIFENNVTILTISSLAIYMLLTGSYKKIESFLTGIVFLMAIIFLLTAIFSFPDLLSIGKGLIYPSLGKNGLMTVVGLIGTTIGPYSLFLHASSAATKWHNKEDYKKSRIDTILSISIGGLISMCIVITASSCLYGRNIMVNNVPEFTYALEYVWGNNVKWFMGTGLFLAGFSSMITAAVGAAYAIGGLLNLKGDLNSRELKLIGVFVIVAGSFMAIYLGKSPIELIVLSQVVNAIILPLIVFFVLYCINSNVMGVYKNSTFNNLLAILAFTICLIMSCINLSNFFKSISKLIE